MLAYECVPRAGPSAGAAVLSVPSSSDPPSPHERPVFWPQPSHGRPVHRQRRAQKTILVTATIFPGTPPSPPRKNVLTTLGQTSGASTRSWMWSGGSGRHQ